MNKPLRLSRSIVGALESEAVARVLLEDGYLGMGNEVRLFEEELASYLGVAPNSVACVSSGTAALHLAVEATVEPGDEVLVQSLTFVSTFQAIRAAGAVPVACEILPDSVTVDLADAARRVTGRTRAIVPVHYASYPGALESIYRFAADRKLRVIEDAAHAFGCKFEGRRIGSFGDIRCFSFDGIKNITSGEGGLVVSEDQDAMNRVRDARLLGVERDTIKRYSGQRSWDFSVSRTGYRFHMSNVLAAIGRSQLRRLESEFAPARVLLAERYRRRLGVVPEIKLFQTAPGVVPHIFPVRITNGRRDFVREQLAALGIETGIHYKPNHLLQLFRTPYSLPVSEAVYGELVSLPLHPGLAQEDVDRVSDALLDVMASAHAA